jgi:hypothetical protein
LQDAGPDRLEVVIGRAVNAYCWSTIAPDRLKELRQNVCKGRLPNSPLAIQHDMSAGLRHGIDYFKDLLYAAMETITA